MRIDTDGQWPIHEKSTMSEFEIIRRRVASAEKWSQRRNRLRLRAALFGRRKLRREKVSGDGQTCQRPAHT
jgi:hypothetical protein